MKAHGLTISIPPPEEGPICDKNCSYCISFMTGYITPNQRLVDRNMPKIKKVAEIAGVSNVLLTSKGEPTMNMEALKYIMLHFGDFPLELQTNGLWLSKNVEQVRALHNYGLDIIAISVDSIDMDFTTDLIKEIHNFDMICRICLNITDMIPKEMHFWDIFQKIRSYGVDQLLIRNITTPPKVNYSCEKAARAVTWIDQHVDKKRYKKLYEDFKKGIAITRGKELTRVLPHGVEVFTVRDIDISFSDYCIQKSNNTIDIRNLIVLENGGMYTSWDKVPGSRLF